MTQPTDLNGLRDFSEWKEKCDIKVGHTSSQAVTFLSFAFQGQPFCSLPNACPLTTRELPGETLRLHTCMECPNYYPWILDPTGNGFSFK